MNRIPKVTMPTTTAGGTQQTISLPEGKALIVSGLIGTAGVIYRLDQVMGGTNSLQSWAVGTGVMAAIGPFAGQQRFLLTCSTGSIETSTADAVLGAIRANMPVGNISAGSSFLPAYPDGNGAGSENRTFSAVISAWGEFNGYQLIYANLSPVACRVNNVRVGVGATIYPNGVNNIAAPSTWYPPTGEEIIPAGADHRPCFYVAPRRQARAVLRAAGEIDGGLYPLLFVRHYIAPGNTNESYSVLPAGWAAKWSKSNEGHTLQTASAYGGDYVTDASSWNAAVGEDSPALVFVGAIFHYDRPFTTVCGVGDSVGAGNLDGGTGICPFGFIATARIRRAGKFVSWHSAGVGGASMPDIAANGLEIVRLIAPGILLLASYTINSPVDTQAAWDAQWSYLMELVQAQLAANRQVLLVTPLPNNSLSATQNGYRKQQRQRVLNSDLPFVDAESLSDANGHWLNPGHAVDDTHMSVLGHQAMAALTQPRLDLMIP